MDLLWLGLGQPWRRCALGWPLHLHNDFIRSRTTTHINSNSARQLCLLVRARSPLICCELKHAYERGDWQGAGAKTMLRSRQWVCANFMWKFFAAWLCTIKNILRRDRRAGNALTLFFLTSSSPYRILGGWARIPPHENSVNSTCLNRRL